MLKSGATSSLYRRAFITIAHTSTSTNHPALGVNYCSSRRAKSAPDKCLLFASHHVAAVSCAKLKFGPSREAIAMGFGLSCVTRRQAEAMMTVPPTDEKVDSFGIHEVIEK